jgi:hypothetical protein
MSTLSKQNERNEAINKTKTKFNEMRAHFCWTSSHPEIQDGAIRTDAIVSINAKKVKIKIKIKYECGKTKRE